jgi:hypothetical protein
MNKEKYFLIPVKKRLDRCCGIQSTFCPEPGNGGSPFSELNYKNELTQGSKCLGKMAPAGLNPENTL